MNKVSVQPFLQGKGSYNIKQVPLTPKAIVKTKKNISSVDKMRVKKHQSSDFEETIHFDDTFCFRENNRKFSLKEKSKDKLSPKKNFYSQLLNVKIINQENGASSKKQIERGDGKKNEVKIINGCFRFDPFQEHRNKQIQADKTKRNYTSYSSRRKNQTIKVQNNYFSQRPRSNSGTIINKSTLVPRMNPQQMIQMPIPQDKQVVSFQKLQGRNKYFWTTDKANHFRGISQDNDNKGVNYYQYSIIRPDQIKSLTLLQREQERQLKQKKKREQKVLYLEMLHQIQKKDQLAKRNARMKEQIVKSSKKSTVKINEKAHQINFPNKKHFNTIQQKNEVRPWDVELNTTQHNLTDII